MTDSNFITFDKVFDKEEIRKTIYEKVPDDKYYDVKLADPVVNDTSNLVSKHIDKLGKGIKQTTNNWSGTTYTISLGSPSTDTKEGDIEKLISLFYLFPFSNSKIKPATIFGKKVGSTSKIIKTAPIKDGKDNKIMYFATPGNNAGQPGTISAKNDKTYTIKLNSSSSTKSSVKKDQLIFLERTTEGETSDYLDEAVYKKYIEIHGIKVVKLLEELKDKSFKEAEKEYVKFVENTDFGDIEGEYASNKFSKISENNSKNPPSASPGSATPGSPTTSGSSGSPASPASPPPKKKLSLNCALTTDTGAGGRRRKRRKTLKKRNTMKNRKTLKKRKATRRRKSTKKRKKRKTTKTKRVKFIL
jgi:hypothetical protein